MTRRIGALCWAALLLFALTSCGRGGGEETPPEGSVGVYFAVGSGTLGGPAVSCEYHTLSGEREPVEELMSLLLAGPDPASRLTSPFPAGVSLLSWKMEDGRLSLDLSEQYGGLSGVDLTVADYCIALTLCQLEGVESVSITVEGHELVFRHTQQLRASDVILTGAEEEPVYINVTLWFPRRDGSGLGVETRQLMLTEDDTLAGAAVSALLEGPAYESMLPTAPEGTELLGTAVEDGVCVVDLSAAFLEGEPPDHDLARLMVYGLVNTLCSLGTSTVELVQIRVEGKPVVSYGGMALTSPQGPDFSLER